MIYAQALPESGCSRPSDKFNVDVQTFFAQDERCRMGMHRLDEQHQELLSTLNRLHDHLLGYSAPTLINKYFSNLTDQARAHFKAEEEVMQARAYPGYKLHKSIHDLLMRQLDDVRIWVAGDYRQSWMERLEIAEFLHACLVSHLEEDKMIGAFEKYGSGWR